MSDARPAVVIRYGLVRMALSALLFSLMGVGIKILTRSETPIPSVEIVFWRGFLCALLTLAMMPRRRHTLVGSRTGLLALRGLFGFAGLLCYTMALASTHYSLATALLLTHPVFTSLFAALLLKERLPRSGILAMAICLVGALLILDPRWTGIDKDMVGGLLGLGSGIFSGLAYTLVRGLSRTESTFTIVLYFHGVAALAAGVLMVPEFVMPDAEQWLWLGFVVITSQAGQVLLTQGLTANRAGTATTVSYIAVALAAVWGWTFFEEHLTGGMATGTALLIVGLGFLSVARKQNA